MIGYEINKLFHRGQTAWFLILLFAIHMIGMWKAETPGVEKYADYTVGDVQAVYAALPRDNEDAREVLTLREQELEQGLQLVLVEEQPQPLELQEQQPQLQSQSQRACRLALRFGQLVQARSSRYLCTR